MTTPGHVHVAEVAAEARDYFADKLAGWLVHTDTGEPLERPVRLAVRDRAELARVRALLDALLICEELRFDLAEVPR